MKNGALSLLVAGLFLSSALAAAQGAADAYPLWDLAKREVSAHRFSTLITAQEVRRFLSEEKGLRDAVNWCKETGVTRVFIESFRDGYQAERDTLQKARQRFLGEGFHVSGCVTPTRVGKQSTGWNLISCYTDKATQDKVQAIFEYAAAAFDEIMIDDFWFTDCACPECEAARKAKTVRVGSKSFPVSGDTWDDYRCELMVQLSRDRVLAAAKRVNPKVQLIIKYPQWYDNFHVRGYDVIRETRDFDNIWVGTETRDYTDQRWGGTPQYEAYFIMRWLGEIGGKKCGGGWFDPYGTTPATYLEQARQTVLAGAAESVLFAYGSLLRDTGPENIRALRQEIPELLRTAAEVRRRKPIGVAAYKPPGSAPQNEARVFDFVGMLGFPLLPCHEFPTNAPAAFLSVHALKDRDLASKLERFVKADRPLLITDGLKSALDGKVDLNRQNIHVLRIDGSPKSLLSTTERAANEHRAALLKPLNTSFEAPVGIGLYLFTDGSWVIENFNDAIITVQLNGGQHEVPARGWVRNWVEAQK